MTDMQLILAGLIGLVSPRLVFLIVLIAGAIRFF